ncbi:MAG: GNAT family N-acetyltransferase [Bacteroidetes bacterium]|nr:GNAT family N-acetyltransferase [Bacteroidota bacterium]
MVSISKATSANIPEIFKMADAIWHIHYINIISSSQIDYMLKKFYSPKAIKQAMNDGEIFYLIFTNDFPIGYISVINKGDESWFINKFYIYTDIHRKGLGTLALGLLEELVKPKTFTLQVNRKNIKTINFYFKNGFIINEWADFDIGNGYFMEDFVMIKKY